MYGSPLFLDDISSYFGSGGFMHRQRTYVLKYKHEEFGVKWINIPGRGQDAFKHFLGNSLPVCIAFSPDPAYAVPLFDRFKKGRSQK
jgi:hypothetical protein